MASSALLKSPTGLTYDSNNNLYVADYENGLVRRVDAVTGIISTVAGSCSGSCSPSYSYNNLDSSSNGDGDLATLATLNGPSYVAFDSVGNMYISEYYNNVIRRVDGVTNIITTFAGSYKSSCNTGSYFGQGAYSGDGGDALDACLFQPSGIAFDTSDSLLIR